MCLVIEYITAPTVYRDDLHWVHRILRIRDLRQHNNKNKELQKDIPFPIFTVSIGEEK